jgi:hypothetical protein
MAERSAPRTTAPNPTSPRRPGAQPPANPATGEDTIPDPAANRPTRQPMIDQPCRRRSRLNSYLRRWARKTTTGRARTVRPPHPSSRPQLAAVPRNYAISRPSLARAKATPRKPFKPSSPTQLSDEPAGDCRCSRRAALMRWRRDSPADSPEQIVGSTTGGAVAFPESGCLCGSAVRRSSQAGEKQIDVLLPLFSNEIVAVGFSERTTARVRAASCSRSGSAESTAWAGARVWALWALVPLLVVGAAQVMTIS